MLRHIAVFFMFWMCAAATQATGLFRPLHCDYSTWVRVARDWQSGHRLYVDTYDNKQPTLFLFVGRIDSPQPAVTLFLAETLMAAVAATLLRALLLTTLPTLAVLIPVQIIVWSGIAETFVGGQTTEALVLWLDVATLAFCGLAARHNIPVLAGLAGGLYFLMVSLRIPCAVHGLAYLPLLWWAAREQSARVAVQLAMAFVVGLALGLGFVYWHAQASGYWQPFCEVFLRNLHYGAIDRVPPLQSLLEAGKVLARLALGNTAAAVFLSCTVFSLTVPPRLTLPERLWLTVSSLWLLAVLIGAWPGGRHYPHYYHVIWAPVASLAALWITRLEAFSAARISSDDQKSPHPATHDAVTTTLLTGRLIAATVSAVIVLGVVRNGYAAGEWRTRYRPRIEHLQQIAESLNVPGDLQRPLAMYVWLDWAELYWRVSRPGVRWSVPHVLPDDLFDQWAEEVLRSRPEQFVYDASFLERVSTNPLGQRLLATLQKDYVVVRQVDDLRVLKRHDQHKDL